MSEAEPLSCQELVELVTDYLDGDLYFRILRPSHNLDRHRSQLRLAERLFAARDTLRRQVEKAAAALAS